MNNETVNYSDLVKQAQLGCQRSMDSLAQLVQGRLYAYIYRLTLNHSLTDDLQQETLLEMVSSLNKLKNPESFWPWLYRTALSKAQHHFRDRQNESKHQQKYIFKEKYLTQQAIGTHGNELENLIDKERTQVILDVIKELKLKHRNLLILRCFDELSYSEISEIVGCSKFNAQIMFYRAKHSLKQKLLKLGFGNAALPMVIGLFGKMTAPSNSVSSTVPAAVTKVSTAAAVVGAASVHLWLTIATIFFAAVLALGGIMSLRPMDNSVSYIWLPKRSEVKSFHYVEQAWDKTKITNLNLAHGRSLSKGAYEQWYYFPEGIDGPLFMMMQRWDPSQKTKLCGWLQNGSGNYYYHSGEKKIYLYNGHLPLRDLNTRRLPADTQEFTDFLDQIEGKITGVKYIRDSLTGLLVGAMDNRFYNAQNFKSNISYNNLNEKTFESFRHRWPADTPIIDQRDTMHKRGWTFFRVTGQIGQDNVEGWGRIPFVYNAGIEHPPWLKLNIGNRLIIIDRPSGAYLTTADGKVLAAYPAGAFFKGLSRPWMGMNTIDIVRRDAVERKIRFSTGKLESKTGGGDEEARVTMFGQTGQGQPQIIYTINIDKDLVKKIEFQINDSTENSGLAYLDFTYLDEVENLGDEFAEPEKINAPKKVYKDNIGLSWLIKLIQGTLGQ